MIRPVSNSEIEHTPSRVRNRPSTPKKRDYAGKVAIRRAVDAVRKTGVDIGCVNLSADGEISIVDRNAMPAQPADEFIKWDADGRL